MIVNFAQCNPGFENYLVHLMVISDSLIQFILFQSDYKYLLLAIINQFINFILF